MNEKVKIGDEVEFFAFVQRVGIDKNMWGWKVTGKVIGIDELSMGSVTILPTDEEFLECYPKKDKIVYRAAKEFWKKEYFREIGSKGGKKSKRTITPEQQKKMQLCRKKA